MNQMTMPLVGYPNLTQLTDTILDTWPEHMPFLTQRFLSSDNNILAISESLAGLILDLAGISIKQHCIDYKWMCSNLLQEEIHFRKTGSYRLSTIKDAYDEVYGRPEYMSRYLNGLLLSQVLWHNQTSAMKYYVENFLGNAKQGGNYLEVGPGHGLFLYFAAKSKKFNAIHGWDISQTSIQTTRDALDTLGVEEKITLEINNILSGDIPDGHFDTVVISEVLEHLEYPEQALNTLFKVMLPDSRIFINVPVNSPAPDHIYLWDNPESILTLVETCGFKVSDFAMIPATGHSLESARKRQLTISTLVTATRP